MFQSPDGMTNLIKAAGAAALAVLLGFLLTFFALGRERTHSK